MLIYSICADFNVFFIAVMGIVLAESLFPGVIPVPRAAGTLCALLFILIGNLMPKIKSNFSTGFKTPWALSSDEVWNRTQRLGGLVLWMGCFFYRGKKLFAGMAGILFGSLLLPTIMSWRWYQQEQKEKRD